MKSYLYPKLIRDEMDPRYVRDTVTRYAAVNEALVKTDRETLIRMGLRCARQKPKAPYEPFGIALEPDALRVLSRKKLAALQAGVQADALANAAKTSGLTPEEIIGWEKARALYAMSHNATGTVNRVIMTKN